MSLIKRLPYLCPSSENISIEDWQISKNGSIQPLEITMPSWDPAVSIKTFTRISINTEKVFLECGLKHDAKLLLAAVWSSAGTVLRGVGERIILTSKSETQKLTIAVDIEGVLLANWVELSINLVLIDVGSTNNPFAAKYPGSILFRSPIFRLYIQGEGARFPVEVIDFGNTQYPNDAAWALFWDPYNLHQTIYGDLRLYINSKHERVREAVSNDKPNNRDIQEAIRFDIARMLIEGALRNEEFINNPDTYSRDSVGFVIKNMIQNYFPNISLSNLREDFSNPQTFEPKLQDRLRIFHSKD
jgi:hypothetical protein